MPKTKKRAHLSVARSKKTKRLPKTASLSHRQRRKAIKHYVKQKRRPFARILLQPISIVLLMAIGILMVGWTYEAIADDIVVTATVPAPPLTQPATITSPTNGANFTNIPITVIGTCPSNSYVELYLNQTMDGVAMCQNNGFQISTDLYEGENTLLAQDYNITNQAGPTGQSITVSYQPSVSSPPGVVSSTPSSSSASSSPHGSSTTPPLLITTNYKYQSVPVNTNFSQTLTIQGGTPPYDLRVTWGDGNASSQTSPAAGPVIINHVYKTAGYYVITVNLTDFKGQTTLIQLAVLVRASGNSKVTSPFTPSTLSGPEAGLGSKSRPLLLVVWPFYVTAFLVVLSFYLGERQEIISLTRGVRHHPKKR